jgi:uncharacterized surface protein with fasciclin (FAS1) repeats
MLVLIGIVGLLVPLASLPPFLPAPEAFAQAPPVAQNVVDTLKAAGTFGQFLKAVDDAGLTGTLTAAGPITVFAPTDAAFSKVSKDTLDAAMKDKAKLTMILKNHIVEGQKITAEQMKMLKTVKTAAGRELPVVVQDGAPVLAGARFVRTDIQASNGVIQAVDTVLMPPQ